MSPLYKMIHTDTVTFSIQSGGNQLPARRSLKTNIHLQRHTLWILSGRSTWLRNKLDSRDASVEMLVAIEKGHLPSQI